MFYYEGLFVDYLQNEGNQSENLIAQLHQLEDKVFISKINTFVDVCGVEDPKTLRVFEMALSSISFGQKLDEGDYKILLEKAIAYSISQHKSGAWKKLLLLNLSEDEIQSKILLYKQLL